MVILFLVVLCGRLFSVQIFQGDEHRKKLVAQAHPKQTIPAERANIFDRNDGALTRNIAHYTISVDPSKITEKNVLAKKLHKITGRSLDYYVNKLNSKKKFEFLERNLKNNIIEEKQFQSISGLNIKKHYRRTYPHGSIAGQILGYTDTDDLSLIHI